MQPNDLISDYHKKIQYGISGNITRGIVADVSDPLYSGRVRVWLPLFHGGLDTFQVASDNITPGTQSYIDNVGGNLFNQQAIQCLPWAPVLGHNWASTSNIMNGTPQLVCGTFNVPKLGTEVFVMFEDDDPNYPIVIGSVFHLNDYKPATSRIPSLEISPGTNILPANIDYNSTVTEAYVIQTAKKFSLVLSEVVGQEEVLLGGSVNIVTSPTVTEFSSAYTTFSSDYPNFPTTQSAPFRARTSIANASNAPLFNVDITQAPIASTAAPQIANQTQANATDTPTTITKQTPCPVTVHWNHPSGNQVFGPRTTGQYHLGADLTFSTQDGTTQLVAPINGIPVFYKANSTGGGTYLEFLGVDNLCHTFMHLTSVNQDVISAAQAYMKNPVPSSGKQYTVGSILGITGGKVGLASSGTHTSGPHLHWEVFKPLGAAQPNSVRSPAYQNGGQYNGTMVFMDPLTWIPQGITGSTIQIAMSPGQAPSYAQLYTVSGAAQFDRPIGLEVGLTPGAEQIYLRHVSGAYLGFDPDGNFKLYTPGSADFKINRNLVFDVLGGIFHSCMAMYNRARQVIKSYATTSIVSKQISVFTDFPSDAQKVATAQAAVKSEQLPNIFTRIDIGRQTDITDALRQSTSNAYYTIASGAGSLTMQQLLKNGYSAPVNSSFIDNINWIGLDSLNKVIVDTRQKYAIAYNGNPISAYITPALLKSIMLLNSQGNIDVGVDSDGLVGLFKLSSADIQYIKNDALTGMLESYADPATNIDLGIQFIFKRASDMYTYLGSTADIYASTSPGLPDVVNAVIMDYAYCTYQNNVSTSIEAIYRTQVIGGATASYPHLEQTFANTPSLYNTPDGPYVFAYAATVNAISHNANFTGVA